MNKLYSNDKTQSIDQLAAAYLGVDSFELMQLAAAAVYQHVKHVDKLLVITGPGNNGGDGFVIAELARQQGQQVKVLAIRDVNELQGDARSAASQYHGEVISFEDLDQCAQYEFELIVDAVFGTGLEQLVRQPFSSVIEWMNHQQAPVLAVDIPSGLNGTTGQIEGVAVKATTTIAILALNTGLFTSDGKDCCGEVKFEHLTVPDSAYQSVASTASLLSGDLMYQLLASRQHNSHKGEFGHVLVAGSQVGMLGAVLLSSQAVLKVGAGSATVLTAAKHAELIPLNAPEIMSRGFVDEGDLFSALNEKNAALILMGMGMGQSNWAKQLYKSCVKAALPLVLDADGLNLLAKLPKVPEHLAVLTPHPKEAAQLLQTTVAAIQHNRWQAVKALAQKYACVAVLKGSGTLVSDGQKVWCCPYGNANLATAGSGDVLAGMIAGLMVQKFSAAEASVMAVIWHALVGEFSRYGLSLTAGDLLDTLHEVWQVLEGKIDE